MIYYLKMKGASLHEAVAYEATRHGMMRETTGYVPAQFDKISVKEIAAP
jgi:hypothetical protein